MEATDIEQVHTADEARQIAIDWQSSLQGEHTSYGEMTAWQSYFEALAEKFPELADEFKENGIV